MKKLTLVILTMTITFLLNISYSQNNSKKDSLIQDSLRKAKMIDSLRKHKIETLEIKSSLIDNKIQEQQNQLERQKIIIIIESILVVIFLGLLIIILIKRKNLRKGKD